MTSRLGSGEMTVRPVKLTRLPERFPRKRPVLPFSRCTSDRPVGMRGGNCRPNGRADLGSRDPPQKRGESGKKIPNFGTWNSRVKTP